MDEINSVESHDEEMVVEALLNINDVERAALKAINIEVYSIADLVPSGDAEEPLSGYWVQALLISHSVAPSQPEFQVVNLSVDSDHPLSHLGKGSRGRHCREW